MNVRKARRMPMTFEYFLKPRALTCVSTITRGVAKSDSNSVGLIQEDERMNKRVTECVPTGIFLISRDKGPERYYLVN